MKVTRDVILDLWPVYEAGEASADTRALVEVFLEEDPDFAGLIRDERKVLMTPNESIAMPPDREIATLVATVIATQTLLKRRMQFLALGLCLPLLAAIYRFPGWMRWGPWNMGRVLLIGIGVVGWVGFWRTHRRLREKGF